MKQVCIFGNPIAHSKSPRLHNHWLQILGIKGRYDRYEVPLDQFESHVRGLMAKGIIGANVTIPFKANAAAFADYQSDFVKQNGVANTLIFGEKIEAHNTDGYGFAQNILAKFPDWNVSGDHIVLGAGGAANAVVAWLVNHGANSVLVINRNQDRAKALKTMGGQISVATWDDLPKHLRGKTTLINTTSLGMNGQNDIVLDLTNAPRDMIVNDIVYTPLETGLLRDAKAAGLRVVDGLDMLLWQARPGFQSWFGAEPPAIDQGLRNFMLSKKVVALTGSIGMGKSTVAAMFRDEGFEIWEADREVDRLYEGDDDLYAFISHHAPEALSNGFDKSIWRDFVFANPEIFPKLEALIHRKIVASRRAFLERDALYKLCDIPLLFEGQLDALYDHVVVVSASADVQKTRVLARGKMNEAQFDEIVAKQMTDEEKTSRADFVIRTDLPLEETRKEVANLVKNWKDNA